MSSIYDRLVETAQTQSPLAAAQLLVAELRQAGRYLELFEALKMLRRLELGLPAVALDHDAPLTPDQAEAIERGLLEACREVGLALIQQGRLQDGWLYMRPVGDLAAVRQAVDQLEATPENLDQFLGILVQEGVDVRRGVRLSLEHRGTCSTITMMESLVAVRSRKDQQAGVSELVQHVHAELLENVRQDVERREGTRPPEETLAAILAARPGFLRDGAYHMDTTHIAATVRLARILDDQEDLRLALDLCRYGRELNANYQYPSDEPFGDLYLMTSYFLSALLGEHTDAALHQFLRKAESLDLNEHGTIGIETYVDLLARIGRPREAMRYLIKKMPPGMRPFGVAPSLLELCSQAGDFELMIEQSKAKSDIIGFAAALLQSKSGSPHQAAEA
jgi:hypothetical protein